MIMSILAMVFTWCLFFGKIPQPYLVLLCVALGVLLSCLGRHKHSHFLSTDVLVQRSRLKDVNATLKFWTIFTLMIICVVSRNSAVGVFLMISALVFAVCVGGLSLRGYVHVLALPVSFLLISGLALLFEVAPEPMGIMNFNVVGLWLCLSEQTQARTVLIVARALGALSCLAFLSITTPMPQIVSVLRRARCPELMIDLMYLIYRYIFILLSLHHEMYNAAKSRLGLRDYRSGLRACGRIYANLLARSYQFAGGNFDAMESRCYDAGIRFLEKNEKITGIQATAAVAMTIITLSISLIFH